MTHSFKHDKIITILITKIELIKNDLRDENIDALFGYFTKMSNNAAFKSIQLEFLITTKTTSENPQKTASPVKIPKAELLFQELIILPI